MSKSKNERRAKIEEQIKKLENERKQILKEEKAAAEKARKQRLTNRGEVIEKLAPHLVTLSDSEFESYMKKVLLPPKSQGGILTESEVAEDEK